MKRGRMSSNRMPGEGKSGNWRRESWSLILRLASWEEEGADGGTVLRFPWHLDGMWVDVRRWKSLTW